MLFKRLKHIEKPCDILNWDDAGLKQLAPSFEGYSYISVPAGQVVTFSLPHLVHACFIVSRKLLGLVRLLINTGSFLPATKNRLGITLWVAKRVGLSVVDLSCVLAIKPRLLITLIDNSVRYQIIDYLVHDQIPCITVQNGNRWHIKSLMLEPLFEHFSVPPSFHSCFCALSKIDIDEYLKSKWQISESYVVGSLNHNYVIPAGGGEKHFINQCQSVYDIAVIANSINSRKSQVALSSLLKRYAASRRVSIVVLLKRQINDRGFCEHHRQLRDLYGDIALIKPRNGSSSIYGALFSKVIIGSYTTLLREVLSLGKKVYPINFDFPGIGYYFEPLKINQSPSQDEFDYTLDNLLIESSESYIERNSFAIDYIGAYPTNTTPRNRLSEVISDKMRASQLISCRKFRSVKQ